MDEEVQRELQAAKERKLRARSNQHPSKLPSKTVQIPSQPAGGVGVFVGTKMIHKIFVQNQI